MAPRTMEKATKEMHQIGHEKGMGDDKMGNAIRRGHVLGHLLLTPPLTPRIYLNISLLARSQSFHCSTSLADVPLLYFLLTSKFKFQKSAKRNVRQEGDDDGHAEAMAAGQPHAAPTLRLQSGLSN